MVRKLNLVTVDNKSEASESTNAAIKLTSQDKVVSHYWASDKWRYKSTIQIAQDNKVPVIAPGGTAPELTFKNGKLNDYIFRTSFIDPFQGTVAANFAANELKVKNAAVFIDNSSDYSKGIAKLLKNNLKKMVAKLLQKKRMWQKIQISVLH